MSLERYKSTRLDRFISNAIHSVTLKDVKLLLAQARIVVDGKVARDANQFIHKFSQVAFDNRILQSNSPQYLMLNKPKGVVSATKDDKNKTVIDIIEHSGKADLHITGRLDFNSTGLMLLTNDSRWSKKLMSPENKVKKVYRVVVEKPLTNDIVLAFKSGMYFKFENITTLPAQLDIISETVAQVTLIEGRYHQIKRMFGRFDNKVLELHRLSIGEFTLDKDLLPGQCRELNASEINLGLKSSIEN